MESQSLKLRNILEFHNLPISPTHRFSLLVHPCELTSLPSLFSSSRIQTAPCCKEPVHFPIDSVETSSSHAFQSASKVEDDDTNSMPSDIGLIQRAVWIGLTTIMSKILRLIREIIVASVFGIGSVATAFNKLTQILLTFDPFFFVVTSFRSPILGALLLGLLLIFSFYFLMWMAADSSVLLHQQNPHKYILQKLVQLNRRKQKELKT
ncbi:hypothetical protein CsSME_00018592 [Camellia sinensis var. sinensis]